MRSDPLQTRLWRDNGGQRAYVKCSERGKVGLVRTIHERLQCNQGGWQDPPRLALDARESSG